MNKSLLVILVLLGVAVTVNSFKFSFAPKAT